MNEIIEMIFYLVVIMGGGTLFLISTFFISIYIWELIFNGEKND